MRVPLHDEHERLGARFVEFAGYEMPVMYSGILEEHAAVRERVGVFDVSHMSNLWIRGPRATDLLSRTVGTNPARIKVGRASYTVAMREDGSIIDDLIYYKFGDDEYHVIVNAGMNKIMTSWFQAHAAVDTRVEDVSQEYCILAVQGPLSRGVVERAMPGAFAQTKKFQFTEFKVGKRKAFVAGTGYTGEDGLEIVVPNEEARRVFPELLNKGKAEGLLPIGLGARDTLRLEKAFCLASHEFAGGRTPLEANLEWVLHEDHDYVGKPALAAQRNNGGYERLVGIEVQERQIPRQGYRVLRDGKPVGTVTSGTMSPSLKKGIALAYVHPSAAAVGTGVAIEVRAHAAASTVVKTPFL